MVINHIYDDTSDAFITISVIYLFVLVYDYKIHSRLGALKTALKELCMLDIALLDITESDVLCFCSHKYSPDIFLSENMTTQKKIVVVASFHRKSRNM